MSEASITSLKSLKSVVARITSGLSKTEIRPSSKDDDDSTPKDISTPNDELLEETTDSTTSNPNNIYVNPMISKLKQTNVISTTQSIYCTNIPLTIVFLFFLCNDRMFMICIR